MTKGAARTKLRSLGARRERLRRMEEALKADTEEALRATSGIIPVSEAAELLHLNRSTIYSTYAR